MTTLLSNIFVNGFLLYFASLELRGRVRTATKIFEIPYFISFT